MIRRHPHVFGNVVAENSEQVWKTGKTESSGKSLKTKTDLQLSPCPLCKRATKLASKPKASKFDWPNASDVEKVREELDETEEALDNF